ncbi:MAG: right-handed parallel beta-helix repeat-containing protein [Acidimicrobiia bacterium]|nr:right-handed parallel beta-helix repeat-containing protein [Acidimicrobiia bacterium]
MRWLLILVLAASGAAPRVAEPGPVSDVMATIPLGRIPAAPALPTLQQQIDNTSAGGTLVVAPGTYREAITLSRPITLRGDGAVEIRGSDVWTGWSVVGDRTWASTGGGNSFYGVVPVLPTGAFPACLAGSDQRCSRTEMVFRDGVPLYQLRPGMVPGPGEFSLVSATDRRVRLGDDPVGHVIEVSVRSVGIHARDSTVVDVTIDGVSVRHVANWREGAIRSGAPRWTLRAVDASDNASWGFELKGDGAVVVGSHVHRNGLLGGSFGSHGTFRGNECDHNGTELPDSNSEGGCLKLAVNRGSRVLDNHIHDEHGAGVWCDINCVGLEVSGNRIERVGQVGVFYEISSGGWIHGNVISDAGMAAGPGIAGACIAVSGSSDTRVEDNVAAWCRDGIVILAANRYDVDGDGAPDDADQARCPPGGVPGAGIGPCTYWDFPYRNEIVANTVLWDDRGGVLFGINQTADSPADACNQANGNRFAGNRRWVAPAAADVGPPQAPGTDAAYDRYLDCAPKGGRFSWLAGYQGTRNGQGLRAMTDGERDAVLAAYGLAPGRARGSTRAVTTAGRRLATGSGAVPTRAIMSPPSATWAASGAAGVRPHVGDRVFGPRRARRRGRSSRTGPRSVRPRPSGTQWRKPRSLCHLRRGNRRGWTGRSRRRRWSRSASA